MTVKYQLQRHVAVGQAWNNIHDVKSMNARIRSGGRAFLNLITKAWKAIHDIKRYADQKNWAIESLSPVALAFGRLMDSLGIHFPMKQR